MRVMVVAVLLLCSLMLTASAVSASDGGELAIGEHAANLEGGGLSILRVIMILTGILIVLIGAFMHHGGAFVTIGLIVVVVSFAGKGIPALVDSTNLAEGATLSREAPEVSAVFMPGGHD